MVKPKALEAKQRDVAGRLPAISGWITERNAFRMLSDACIQGFKDCGNRVGVIRGPDYSTLDGGLIFDPPEGFPMDMDPSAVWAWANEHKDEKNLQIVPIDVKLTVNSRSAHQSAPIFVVAPPGHPEILCLLPIYSYTSMMANMKLEYTDSRSLQSNKAHRLRLREPLHVSSLLAPFVVHERDLFEALLRLGSAFKDQSTYTNPSNGVEMRGWTPPKPDPSLEQLMRVSMDRQQFSAIAIQKLVQTLRSQPGCQIELSFNLVQPLGCDLVLRDKASSTMYLIEHKATAPSETKSGSVSLKPRPEWAKEELNWHFLFHQCTDLVVIHTREGHKKGSDTPPVSVDLRDPNAAFSIATTIRDHGNLAKQRLQTKWQTLDLYEDSLLGEGSPSGKLIQQKHITHGRAAANEQLRIAFCDAFNDQSYKLGKHVCIVLEGNACGDAVVIRHDWTDDDILKYKESRTLPVSLVDGMQFGSSDALVLRFISHHWPPSVPSSQIFEPARIKTIKIPMCMGQPFIYVAATISSPSADRQPSIDKLILLPSEETDWMSRYNGCSACDDKTRPRDWKPVVQTFQESQGTGHPGSSLVQLPFLNEKSDPLRHIYDFCDGSVHSYLDAHLSGQSSRYVTSIYGPTGLLQRQWNHGSPRIMNTGHSAIQNMMHRVLTTLPPNTEPMPSDHIDTIYDQKKKEIMEEKDLKERTVQSLAHEPLINDDVYGMSLADIMALSGFETRYTLRCDHCKEEDSCRFYVPGIAHSLKVKIACGACWGKRSQACTFSGIANTPELMDAIRNFDAFRRHVPCNQCYTDGDVCDNRPGLCERCENGGKVCIREACKNGSEPGDDSSCPKDCDKAHDDDGYTNVSEIARGKGLNARLQARKNAQAHKGVS